MIAGAVACSCPPNSHIPNRCEAINRSPLVLLETAAVPTFIDDTGDADDPISFSIEPRASTTLDDLSLAVFEINAAKGWANDGRTIGDDLALLHSEISEMLMEHRSGHAPNHLYFTQPDGSILDPALMPNPDDKPEGIGVEAADLLIRLVDFTQRRGIDLDRMVEIKMRFNAQRPHRHGGRTL